MAKQTIIISAVILAQVASVLADLRMASTPKNNFNTIDQNNSVKFVPRTALYMEPSTFDYRGLAQQKRNNYDNFLRSNVDNEQDNRNFNREEGADMLPFRTSEAESKGAAMTMAIGTESLIPLRWNNPHASECEVNVWVADGTVVVPIKRPVCCGEGYQDNIISATVPADFNKIASTVPGFTGCNKVGDCVLQIYAHSVEPRTYAIGVPLILTGGDNISSIPKATDTSAIKPATQDPGLDLSKLANEVCSATNDRSQDITSAVPQFARLVSDVYNHAYQNSDYSPYSGQQHEFISKNMQAATILRMTAANGGELGKSILTNAQKQARQTLINQVNAVVQKYESKANQIFKTVDGRLAVKSAVGSQTLADCYRCDQVGSLNTRRLQTQTYIPSYELPATLAARIESRLADRHKSLISDTNVVQIYVAALNEVQDKFEAAKKYDIEYMGPMVKTTTTTMADATNFKKINANGRRDGGVYAATMAKAAREAAAAAPTTAAPTTAAPTTVAPTTKPPVADQDIILTDDDWFVINSDETLEGNPDDSYLPEEVIETDVLDSAAGTTSSSFAVAATFVVAAVFTIIV